MEKESISRLEEKIKKLEKKVSLQSEVEGIIITECGRLKDENERLKKMLKLYRGG